MAAPRGSLTLNPQAAEYYPLSRQTPLLIYSQTPPVNLNYNSVPFHPQPSIYTTTTTHHLQTLPTPPTAAPSPNSTHFRRPPARRWSGGGTCNRRSNWFRRNNFEERENNDINYNNRKFKFDGDGNDNINGFSRVVGFTAVRRSAKRPVKPLKYGEGNVTTVMIKNIPNKLTRWGLLSLLDKHCMLVNQVSKESGNDNVSAYDFIYLPMDFKTGLNKGYAFVNFANTKAVWEFHNEFHRKKWEDFASPKIGEIVCAMIQGKEELMRHFGSTLFMCGSDIYLPLCFSPARDGSGQPVEVLTVGKRNSTSY